MKPAKRILSLLLALTLLVLLLPQAALRVHALGYSGSCGNSVNWALDTDTGLLKITGSGAMYDYGSSDDIPWHDYATSIKTVTIGSGVTSIGNRAFYDCSSITAITIPDTVTVIGEVAFLDCFDLTQISIPASVIHIGLDAFDGCTSLTKITVASGNKYYSSDDAGVLFNAGKTELIKCPAAYQGSYTVPAAVRTISDNSFYSCSGLTGISLPENVAVLGKSAFNHCTKLTEVSIPAGVTSIGDKAFYYCSSLQRITVAAGNSKYSSNEEGVLFDRAKTRLIQYPGGRTGGYVIPDSVSVLGSLCFANCRNLSEVTIPNSVTTIEMSAFYECKGLNSVVIPNSVVSLGDHAFARCSNLVNITISNRITKLYLYTFAYCDSLESLVIPKGIESIGSEALYCSNLKSVVIPTSVTEIASDAFGHLSIFFPSLLNVTIYGVEGSYANTYASKNNISFVAVPICEADGHTFDYSVAAAPTVVAAGRLSGQCEYCDATDTVTLPKLSAADYTLTVVTPPGCTTSGLHRYTWRVTDYGVQSFEMSIFPLGHNYEQGVCNRCGCLQSDPDARLPFIDVKESAYYYYAVRWAVNRGIASGTSATTFGPKESCSRAQVMTFLWKAAGSPEPVIGNPFTDVKPTSYYYKAVLWAVENNIATGTSSTTFGPKGTCTRAQIVTFLWNYCGSPEPLTTENPFTDVKPSSYYYKAVLWAYENDVTTGTSPTTFGPKSTCTRAQVVTFLWKALT